MCFKGNIKFGAQDNAGALKLYTESVICAPEVGPELGLAFGNRLVAFSSYCVIIPWQVCCSLPPGAVPSSL